MTEHLSKKEFISRIRKRLKATLVISLFAVGIVFSLYGCNSSTDLRKNAAEAVVIPPDYYSFEEHWDESHNSFKDTQAFVDYCKYLYNDETSIKGTGLYRSVTSDSVEYFAKYYFDFNYWMRRTRAEEWSADKYDLDETIITPGDLFLLKTPTGEPNGNDDLYESACYALYYFDTETRTLYYIYVRC